MSMEASCHACERYLFICYKKSIKGRIMNWTQSWLLLISRQLLRHNLLCLYLLFKQVWYRNGDMKFHTKKRLMESIKHLDTYLVTFLNHIQSCHVCS